MDDAKITGMTPPVFTLSGIWVLDPPYCRRPTTRLAYCTVIRRCPRSTKMIAADDDDHHHEEKDDPQQADLPGPHLIERRQHSRRQAHDDARVDQQRHPVPDAPLGNLLAEPHDEHRARRQCEDAHQTEAPARVVDQRQTARDLRLSLEKERDAQRLHERQHQRQVARVLRDLAATQFAFLRNPFERRPDDRQQLQDDRRADIRHDAERENRDLRKVAAGKHVVQTEHRVPRLLGHDRERLPCSPPASGCGSRCGTRREAPA